MSLSGCLTCGVTTEPSLRNGKPKKYCSKKCAQKFHHLRTYPKRNPNWGKKTIEKKQRKERLEWLNENRLTTQQLADLLECDKHRVRTLSKKKNLKPEIVSQKAFWPLNSVEILKQEDYKEPLPEGYINREQAGNIFGVAKNTFTTYKIKPDMEWKGVGHNHKIYLYKKERIENLYKEKQEAEELKKYMAKEKIRLKEEKRLLREKEQKEKKLQKQVLKKQKAEQIRLNKLETLNKKRKKEREAVIKREDDWRHWKAREEALFDRFDSKLEKYANDEKKYCMHLNAIQKNKQYRRLLDSGITHKFTCSHCAKEYPYYNFHYDNTYNEGRRITKCRFCITKINKKQYKSKKSVRKQRRNENYRSKFRTLIAIQIKRDVSKMRDGYAKDLSTAFIWKKINQNCGYTIDDFILAFETKFEEEMSWLNHGRGGKGDIIWQIDHIIPRSSFLFTSLDDPKFSECWSLDNLQPLWAYDNQIKNLKEHNQFLDNC